MIINKRETVLIFLKTPHHSSTFLLEHFNFFFFSREDSNVYCGQFKAFAFKDHVYLSQLSFLAEKEFFNL